MFSRLPVWAPSAVADPLFREVPKAVTLAEIDEIVAGYALVAEHCAEGGFDGIELQCSHSSIVRGFLSPATNRRTDEYGGSLENRARILVEIVAAVRRVIGTRLALGVRLCGDELIEHGTTIDDAVRVAQIVEATGQVDYINTSIGVATASLFMIEASMHVPPGYAMFIPSAIRKAVELPVVGRRAVQGSAAGRTGARRGPLRSRRRRARADRRRRLRRQGPCRMRPTRHACACRATRSASAAWASTAGSGASRTRARDAKSEGVGLARLDAEAEVGDGRRCRPGRPAGGDRGAPQRPPRHRVRAAGGGRRPGEDRRVGAQPGRVRRHDPQPADRVPAARRGVRVRRRRVAGPGRRAPARPRDRGHRGRTGATVVGAGRRGQRRRRA